MYIAKHDPHLKEQCMYMFNLGSPTTRPSHKKACIITEAPFCIDRDWNGIRGINKGKKMYNIIR